MTNKADAYPDKLSGGQQAARRDRHARSRCSPG
jgi:ABC-type polar amino acid transport system ATPase subunit